MDEANGHGIVVSHRIAERTAFEGRTVASTPDDTRLQEIKLDGFSEDVRSIARELEPALVTIWQLADALLQAHRGDSGIAPGPSLAGRAGEPRLPAGWL